LICIFVVREGEKMAGWFKKGILTALLLLLGPIGGQAVYAQPLGIGSSQNAEQSEYQVLSSSGGRFVFGQISDSTKDQFMLDTATGRLWRVGESGKVGIFLKAVPYLDAEGECTMLPDTVPDSKQKRPEKK
jgi:hypothetical protein